MGLFDSLFGSTPSAQTSQQPTMTDEQKALLSQMIQQLMAGPMTTSAATTPYTGSFTQPLTDLQKTSLAALEQDVMNRVSGTSSSDVGRKALEGIVSSGGSPVNFDDVFTNSVEQPLLYDFTNKVLPALQSTFAGNAAFGSDKAKQREILTKNLTDTLVSERSKMAYQTNSDAINRMIQAAGMLPAADQANTTAILSALAGGSVEQQTGQNELLSQYNEFLRQQQAKATDIQQILQALGLRSFENVTTVTPGSSGLLGGIAQGFGGALGQAAGGFFGL